MPMKPRFSLDFKLSLMFLVVALLPFLVFSFLTLSAARRHLRDIVKTDAALLSRHVGQSILHAVESTVQHTDTLAKNGFLVSALADTDDIQRELSRIQNFYGAFESITLVNPQGKVIASTDLKVRRDWKTLSWFPSALDGQASFSEVYSTVDPFRLVYLTFAPVYSAAGDLQGVLVGQINLEYVWSLAFDSSLMKKGLFFVVDQKGKILFHPDQELRLQTLHPKTLLTSVLSQRQGMVNFRDEAGQARIVSFSAIAPIGDQSLDWKIGYVQLREVSFALEDSIKKRATLISLLGIFLILLLSTAISGTIANPIRKLANATKKIAEGDLDSRVHISGYDEIAELAKVFNEMVRKLRFSRGELVAEKERLGVTLRSITDGVVTVDIEGKILIMNQAAELLVGVDYEDVKGKKIHDIVEILQDERDEVDDAFSLVATPHDEIYMKNRTKRFKTKTGNTKIVEVSVSTVKDKAGLAIGSVVVLHDITSAEKIRNELHKMQKLETIGVLAGGIAHDFNNILTSIVGNVSLAKFEMSPESEPYKLLEDVERTSMEAKQLTQQLLAFSRGGSPVKKVVDLAPLIRDAIEFVTRGSNTSCEFSIYRDLWMAEADAGQIRQVLHNLTINAMQAMPDGGRLKISAENVTVKEQQGVPLAEGMYVKIAVRDEGVGISSDNLNKIFDPFFTTKAAGNGLGLSGTYSIVKKHGGHIDVFSEPGEGTIFYIYLPAVKRQIMTVEEEKKELIKGHGRILIMDDEESLRNMYAQFLKKLGFEYVLTSNGEEAIEVFRSAAGTGDGFRVVILDLTVRGGMGGKEAVKRIKDVDPKARVIVSSGYSMDPIMANYQEYGFSATVPKPFGIMELSASLRKVLESA